MQNHATPKPEILAAAAVLLGTDPHTLAEALRNASAPKAAPAEPSYSPTEAAGLLKVHKLTIRRRINAGELPARKIGRQWRIPAAALRQFMMLAN